MSQQFQCLNCEGVYFDQQRDGSLYFHVCPPQPPDKNGVVREWPDARNENIDLDRRGRVQGIIAEGMGVKCLTDPNVDQPAWLSAIDAQLAKEEGA